MLPVVVGAAVVTMVPVPGSGWDTNEDILDVAEDEEPVDDAVVTVVDESTDPLPVPTMWNPSDHCAVCSGSDSRRIYIP